MVGTKHQVSFSNNKHLVIGCQVCQPIREEEIKTILFSDWFTNLTTNHEVFVFRKRDLMFRTKHGIDNQIHFAVLIWLSCIDYRNKNLIYISTISITFISFFIFTVSRNLYTLFIIITAYLF